MTLSFIIALSATHLWLTFEFDSLREPTQKRFIIAAHVCKWAATIGWLMLGSYFFKT